MTQTASAAAELTLDTTREIRQQFATDIAIERTRLLYQGSWVPTLFMLLNGAACAFLLWAPPSRVLLSGWLIWLVLLAVLRLLQVSAFNRAQPSRQVQAHWRRNFLFGAGASGLTLAFAAIALVPADVFYQQALVYGLIAAAILSASVAYAVSLSAFLTFTVPCVLPFLAVMLLSNDPRQQSWGVLGLILSATLLVVTWQINRLIKRSLNQREQNQALISNLEYAK